VLNRITVVRQIKEMTSTIIRRIRRY